MLIRLSMLLRDRMDPCSRVHGDKILLIPWCNAKHTDELGKLMAGLISGLYALVTG
jgi:hypothetical protein